jgi:wyosine [tRNA(Phe)-imidazoG37] synthetase (radical SAM superfamily)
MSVPGKRHVYGPVPSRRLGRSLGVDLVPFKTCTYDCLYCQLGRTTRKTLQRREYLPVDALLQDVKAALARDPPADYLCLAGSGEPTLHSRIGEVIHGIKGLTHIPVAVLTNGALLWDRQVRRSLLEADLVLPSLDAGDPASFRYVNRPHPDLSFDQILEGLLAFRREYSGPVWLEVFLIAGATGTVLAADRIADQVRRLRPDRVQLNTVTRPPAEEYIFPVPDCLLKSIRPLFGPKTEVIASFAKGGDATVRGASARRVLDLLARRPCTLDDIAAGLGAHRMEVAKQLDALHRAGRVRIEHAGDRPYYCVAGPGARRG